jgi:hypothetical protein
LHQKDLTNSFVHWERQPQHAQILKLTSATKR